MRVFVYMSTYFRNRTYIYIINIFSYFVFIQCTSTSNVHIYKIYKSHTYTIPILSRQVDDLYINPYSIWLQACLHRVYMCLHCLHLLFNFDYPWPNPVNVFAPNGKHLPATCLTYWHSSSISPFPKYLIWAESLLFQCPCDFSF